MEPGLKVNMLQVKRLLGQLDRAGEAMMGYWQRRMAAVGKRPEEFVNRDGVIVEAPLERRLRRLEGTMKKRGGKKKC